MIPYQQPVLELFLLLRLLAWVTNHTDIAWPGSLGYLPTNRILTKHLRPLRVLCLHPRESPKTLPTLASLLPSLASTPSPAWLEMLSYPSILLPDRGIGQASQDTITIIYQHQVTGLRHSSIGQRMPSREKAMGEQTMGFGERALFVGNAQGGHCRRFWGNVLTMGLP